MQLAKFAEDPEWLELVLSNICPVCFEEFNPRQQKLIKKGIKRECSQGHLIIYGNPQFVNYFKIEKKKPYKHVEGCPRCGGRAVTYDKKHDEIFCDSCGLVLSGPPQEIGPGSWVNYPWGNRFDYSDIDATYSPYEDNVDYGTYVPEW